MFLTRVISRLPFKQWYTPPRGWVVLDSDGTAYPVSLAVLDSDDTSYGVTRQVLDADGTVYRPV